MNTADCIKIKYESKEFTWRQMCIKESVDKEQVEYLALIKILWYLKYAINHMQLIIRYGRSTLPEMLGWHGPLLDLWVTLVAATPGIIYCLFSITFRLTDEEQLSNTVVLSINTRNWWIRLVWFQFMSISYVFIHKCTPSCGLNYMICLPYTGRQWSLKQWKLAVYLSTIFSSPPCCSTLCFMTDRQKTNT